MLKRYTLVIVILIAGVLCLPAYAENDFTIQISPELQERLDFAKSRVEHPDTNFGYRTIYLSVQPKNSGDRPVIWAKFYDADDILLETIWNRIKIDGRQKIKFDYMDVEKNAVRVTLSSTNQN
ncbi:MAG: hypothetical protein GY697_09900 [Desulfobacterales bacterium]|nr:hypothetical protein [Desulfobacterales bacterium]